MSYTMEVNKVTKLDSGKIMANLKVFLEDYDIEDVLFLDQCAIDELYIFSQMNINVYAQLENDQLASLFKKELRKVRPVTDILDKVDLIVIPSDRALNYLDLEEERKKLRKKGLLLYKHYNFPKKGEVPVVLQQYHNKVGFINMLNPRDMLTKLVITQNDTRYFCSNGDDQLSSDEIKALIKIAGFKKDNVFDEHFGLSDKDTCNYVYRVYQKSKGVLLSEQLDEEMMPLMTSGEISERFNEAMEKNNLSREDFNL